MRKIIDRGRGLGRPAWALLPMVLLLALATAGCPSGGDYGAGEGLQELEAKLDAIEAKLDAPPDEECRVLPDNSESRINPDVPEETRRLVTQAAQGLQCINPFGCTCFLDGAQTSCAFALACIDAGFCECVSGCGNIG